MIAFKSRQPCVGIVGLGYVGLKEALAFANVDLNVIGYDINDTLFNLFSINVRISHHNT